VDAVGSLTFEQVFPIARHLAHQKAVVFVRRFGFEPYETDELESRLLLIAWRRFDKFDSSRASMRTFLSRLMDSELSSILRASGRTLHAEPLPDSVPAIAAQDDAVRGEFWIDLGRALAQLSPEVRETAFLLSWLPPAKAGRALGCSRGTVWARIRQMRDALLAVGIGPDYFAAAGGAQ
jgi:DNA-directed RNA polymerase specialized sigma24 family protein